LFEIAFQPQTLVMQFRATMTTLAGPIQDYVMWFCILCENSILKNIL